jgi:hypothetical protein
MSDELYAGSIPFGVKKIDADKLFSKVGRIVSMRLITDPHTGQPRWFAFVEIASKTKVKQAVGTLKLKILMAMFLAVLNRHPGFWQRTVLIMAAMILLGSSFSQAPVCRTQSAAKTMESELDREIRRVMEKGINLEERRRQVPAIAATFARRTDPRRARWLAALCYLKTLGTPFMPLDIAEIALAETGEFGLSGTAVSPKGAMGVWQLMPHRAESHGYSPTEMKNDEKCAEAAVRELISKLKMANGDMIRAKKLYCGAGPAADAYEEKIRQFKKEILEELAKTAPQRDKIQRGGVTRLS